MGTRGAQEFDVVVQGGESRLPLPAPPPASCDDTRPCETWLYQLHGTAEVLELAAEAAPAAAHARVLLPATGMRYDGAACPSLEGAKTLATLDEGCCCLLKRGREATVVVVRPAGSVGLVVTVDPDGNVRNTKEFSRRNASRGRAA
jgi:hypothetical protein